MNKVTVLLSHYFGYKLTTDVSLTIVSECYFVCFTKFRQRHESSALRTRSLIPFVIEQ